MKRALINFTAFQVGWFACVLGAAHGYPWLGPVYVVAWVAAHVFLSSHRLGEFALVIAAGAVGYMADSTLVLTGMLTFPEQAQLGAPSTIWMAAMWVNFAATLNISLRWLHSRKILAIAFGAIGGPAAYYTGMRLDAVSFPESITHSLIAVGLEWAVAVPFLLWLAAMVAEPRTPRPPVAINGGTS